MSDGKLRNKACPCNSGKKYKKCHWPTAWNDIILLSTQKSTPKEVLPDYQPEPEVIDVSPLQPAQDITLVTEPEIVK